MRFRYAMCAVEIGVEAGDNHSYIELFPASLSSRTGRGEARNRLVLRAGKRVGMMRTVDALDSAHGIE